MIGAQATLLTCAVTAVVAAGLAKSLWRRPLALGTASLVIGAAAVGATLEPPTGGMVRESDYGTIRVQTPPEDERVRILMLDKLIHSVVMPGHPEFLHYRHEEIQMEFLRAAPHPARVLVIGGGGYTFPRAARTMVPDCRVDVVEIDPVVTAVATEFLGLEPALGIQVTHADGRRFLEESASASAYDLVTMDAVNDLSVPPHLLTRECAAAAKRALKPSGVYLVSVIDILNSGELWPAALVTLQRKFAHVELLQSRVWTPPEKRAVFVLGRVGCADRFSEIGRRPTGGCPADLCPFRRERLGELRIIPDAAGADGPVRAGRSVDATGLSTGLILNRGDL